MSNIPSHILSALVQFSQPGMLAGTPGFRLMGALRRKFAELNDTLPVEPRSMTLEMRTETEQRPYTRLTPAQLDAVASAVKAEISVDLTEQDLDELASRLVDTFQSVRAGFEKAGFYDPTSAAIQMMSKFSVTF